MSYRSQLSRLSLAALAALCVSRGALADINIPPENLPDQAYFLANPGTQVNVLSGNLSLPVGFDGNSATFVFFGNTALLQDIDVSRITATFHPGTSMVDSTSFQIPTFRNGSVVQFLPGLPVAVNLNLHDSALLLDSNGVSGSAHLYGTSSASLMGSGCNELVLHDDSTLSGHNGSVGYLTLHDNATATLTRDNPHPFLPNIQSVQLTGPANQLALTRFRVGSFLASSEQPIALGASIHLTDVRMTSSLQILSSYTTTLTDGFYSSATLACPATLSGTNLQIGELNVLPNANITAEDGLITGPIHIIGGKLKLAGTDVSSPSLNLSDGTLEISEGLISAPLSLIGGNLSLIATSFLVGDEPLLLEANVPTSFPAPITETLYATLLDESIFTLTPADFASGSTTTLILTLLSSSAIPEPSSAFYLLPAAFLLVRRR